MGENAGKEAKISSSSSSLIHGAGAWAVKKTSYWLMQERNEQDAKCVFECLNSIKRSRSKFFSSAIRLLTCLMICRGVCYLLNGFIGGITSRFLPSSAITLLYTLHSLHHPLMNIGEDGHFQVVLPVLHRIFQSVRMPEECRQCKANSDM